MVVPHRIFVLPSIAMTLVATLAAPVACAQPDGAPAGEGQRVVKTARTHESWNPNVSCTAVITTLAAVLGDKTNPQGGATYRGGHFRPGIPDKRSFHPPCRRHHVRMFVQLNRVKMGTCTKINKDGDWTCELTDPTVPKGRSAQMSMIHVETDAKFRTHRGWTRPPGNALINVQGFVFWDPGHTTAAWHHYTGWEIHSLTAWRRSAVR